MRTNYSPKESYLTIIFFVVLLLTIIFATIGCSKQLKLSVTDFNYVSGYTIVMDDKTSEVTIIGTIFCDSTKTYITEESGNITIKSGPFNKSYVYLRTLDPEGRVLLIKESDGKELLLLKFDEDTWFLQTPITLIRLSKTPYRCEAN